MTPSKRQRWVRATMSRIIDAHAAFDAIDCQITNCDIMTPIYREVLLRSCLRLERMVAALTERVMQTEVDSGD